MIYRLKRIQLKKMGVEKVNRVQKIDTPHPALSPIFLKLLPLDRNQQMFRIFEFQLLKKVFLNYLNTKIFCVSKILNIF